MEWIYTHPALSGLQAAFTIWMLVDAYRRGADSIWFFVILLVPIVGTLAYFFAVKLADFKHFELPGWLQHRTSLDELRFRCQQTPTLATHLEIAERLMERQEYEEALTHLEAASKVEPYHGRLLYCRAKCHARLGKPELGRPLLEELIRSDPRWSYYEGWHLLIELLDQSGDSAAALDSCRQLMKLAPTLQHQCLLAEHLLDAGLKEEAVALLRRAVQEFDYLVGPSRRPNRKWGGTARRLLREADMRDYGRR